MDAWCIEVTVRDGLIDAGAVAIAERARALGSNGPPLAIRGFLLPAELPRDAVERAANELLADPISDRFALAEPGETGASLWSGHETSGRLVVRRRPGVMDPVARSAREALGLLGIEAVAVGTYRAWLVPGLGDDALAKLGDELANDVIEEVLVGQLPPGLPLPGGRCRETRVELPLADLDEAALVALSAERSFALNAIEMRAVQGHFVEQGRAPTLTELETIAQTWSEHCKHKTLTGQVVYDGPDGETRYDNLLKETVFATTQRIDHWFCRSVFVDNAGVIDFDDEDCLAIKVETHNHPSAIEPFGGAGTGIGGVIRDILGTGLGAKPLCNIDVFCVAPPDLPQNELPTGCLHPARVLNGVIEGVRDYGNPMGIPTVTGAIHFDPAFVGNPLVYAGTVGILPKNKVEKAARPGDHILVAGGRTGRDGIHGATFSSLELHEESETVSSGAVQIGDPITEKKVLDGLLVARDAGLYTATTDCGAGGLSSAVGEMGEETGARVELSRVPLKYDGLTPTEVWISEAQERMVFAVPPENVDAFCEVFSRFEVETTDIGVFTDDKRLHLSWEGEEICDLDMEFLHDGVPRPSRAARWRPAEHSEPEIPDAEHGGPSELNDVLLGALADFGTCSKEWVLRQYDHEVQGMSAAKPFSGLEQKGPGDAAVLQPKPDSATGFAVATGLNPRYSWVDPAAMAEAAIDEALRNVVARGGDPTRCAVLDNYCWGNCDKPEQLGALVRATEAVCEAALYYRTPFVSGKDSLNNEFRVGDETIAIPGCLLVTALAIVPDVDNVPDSAFTRVGNSVFLVGRTYRELGGSLYYKLHGALGSGAPRSRHVENIATMRFVHEAISMGFVSACHDLSEGGLGVAACEMAFGSGHGITLDLGNLDVGDDSGDADAADEHPLRDDEILFSESLGRFLVEVPGEKEHEFLNFLEPLGVSVRKVGIVDDEGVFGVDGTMGDRLVHLELERCREAWAAPLARGPLACASTGGQS